MSPQNGAMTRNSPGMATHHAIILHPFCERSLIMPTELSDAGGPVLPNWQPTWPARIRSSDFVSLALFHCLSADFRALVWLPRLSTSRTFGLCLQPHTA